LLEESRVVFILQVFFPSALEFFTISSGNSERFKSIHPSIFITLIQNIVSILIQFLEKQVGERFKISGEDGSGEVFSDDVVRFLIQSQDVVS